MNFLDQSAPEHSDFPADLGKEPTVPRARYSRFAELTIEMAVFVDTELFEKYVRAYGSSPYAQLQDFVTTVINNVNSNEIFN